VVFHLKKQEKRIMKIFLLAVAGMLVAVDVYANLQVNQYSVLGENCYSEDIYNWRLVECNFNIAVDRLPDLQDCPGTLDELMSDNYNAYCRVSGGDKSWRICVSQAIEEYSEFMREACEELAYIDDSYKAIAGNKVSYEYVSKWEHASVGKWVDNMTIVKETGYGCVANYYTTATTHSSSMTCLACPPSGIGKSESGNTAITGCYIPANTVLTDVSGSYEYVSDCYYSK